MGKEKQSVGDSAPAYHNKQWQLNMLDGSEDTGWRKHGSQTQTWKKYNKYNQKVDQVFLKIDTGK